MSNLFIFLSVVKATILGIIHLVRTQDFPENFYFLPPDMHAYQEVRNVSFSENFAYLLNE